MRELEAGADPGASGLVRASGLASGQASGQASGLVSAQSHLLHEPPRGLPAAHSFRRTSPRRGKSHRLLQNKGLETVPHKQDRRVKTH